MNKRSRSRHKKSGQTLEGAMMDYGFRYACQLGIVYSLNEFLKWKGPQWAVKANVTLNYTSPCMLFSRKQWCTAGEFQIKQTWQIRVNTKHKETRSWIDLMSSAPVFENNRQKRHFWLAERSKELKRGWAPLVTEVPLHTNNWWPNKWFKETLILTVNSYLCPFFTESQYFQSACRSEWTTCNVLPEFELVWSFWKRDFSVLLSMRLNWERKKNTWCNAFLCTNRSWATFWIKIRWQPWVSVACFAIIVNRINSNHTHAVPTKQSLRAKNTIFWTLDRFFLLI